MFNTYLGGIENLEGLFHKLSPRGLVLLGQHFDVPELSEVEVSLLLQTFDGQLGLHQLSAEVFNLGVGRVIGIRGWSATRRSSRRGTGG